MPNDPLSFFLSIVAGAITVAITFYIKEFLQARAQYSDLRKKLEAIAGKNAAVIYSPNAGGLGSIGAGLYKISEIGRNGVTLRNEIQTVFIPVKRLLESEVILPCDDYENARLAKLRKDMEDFTDALIEPMIKKMVPIFLEIVQDQMEAIDSPISMTVAMRIQSVLKDEGLEIKRIDKPRKK